MIVRRSYRGFSSSPSKLLLVEITYIWKELRADLTLHAMQLKRTWSVEIFDAKPLARDPMIW